MTTREQLTHERLQALLSMLTDDGRKPPGEVDPEHVDAIREAREPGEGRQVAQAHRNGEAAPDVGPGADQGTGGGE